jgi:2-oxoisovalerate dehydrogenase E1 component
VASRSESSLRIASSVDPRYEPAIDWSAVVEGVLVSRALDLVEEKRLAPEKKVLYQFSARGHELSQVLVGEQLTHPHDAASVYYRSRPLVLSLGLPLADAVAASLAKAGGISDGRDIGVVFNMPSTGGATVLPMCGGVGSQFTPAVGWAQMIRYRATVLGESAYEGAIALAHGGDASVAANGFWSALTIATTQSLPMLFFIEDNGIGISVPSTFQTPGGNIAENLRSFGNLEVFDGSGTNPHEAADLVARAVRHVREGGGPALLRLVVPRLSGHAFQDNQQSTRTVTELSTIDPVARLRAKLVPGVLSTADWHRLEAIAEHRVEAAIEAAEQRSEPDVAALCRHVFFEVRQKQGGLSPEPAKGGETHVASVDGPRINMSSAIRQTLDHELETNPKVLVFGEDVGRKGGVHTVTAGLQEKFGSARVFDTSLSEEGIVGRAVGMAFGGLLPVAELQFRKYAEPAAEQLNDCGTTRWRTANRFAAPIVVRVAGGFARCGDPWHSQTNEAQWAHSVGWKIAFPSNAADAVGLLRAAMRGRDPAFFFEHRALLDAPSARRPYPGDDFVLPFGQARVVREGERLTVVTWGAMVARCEAAAELANGSVEIIDLRTIVPWDSETVLASVRKTRRCLVVHEDTLTGGFGAEIVAVLMDALFFDLDAPVARLAMPDIPSPYNVRLLEVAVPSVDAIAAKMVALMSS